MRRDDLGVFLAVVSARRPENVPKMQALIGQATWFVPAEDAAAYWKAGASAVVVCGKLAESRNAALRAAFVWGLPCLMVDDDLGTIGFKDFQTGKVRQESFEFAVVRLRQGLAETGFYLAGVSPTANAFFSAKPISTRGFCIAAMLLVKPCGLTFDEQFDLKEDYDYTLQHIMTFGGLARRDDLLPHFKHYGNAGGVVSYRTKEKERENAERLLRKWPGLVKLNPKRENEVLLNFSRKR